MDAKPIVHVATDEKFIDAAYDIYEKALPYQNKFIILLAENGKKIEYLSSHKPYLFVDTCKDDFEVVLKVIEPAKVVIFHGLNYQQAQIVTHLREDQILVWTVFGSEVYNNPLLLDKKIYGPLTYQKYIAGLKATIKDGLRALYYNYVKIKPHPYKVGIRAMQRFDFVSILYSEEFEFFRKKRLIEHNTRYIKFTYYPLDIIINRNSGFVDGGNILLGNSASYSNNHIEAFKVLRKFNLGKRNVITPLSYGRKDYREDIIKVGESLFSSNFYPLTEFLTLDEYQKVMRSCGIVIMNHYRQQGVGNVVNALYLGAKVFLSQKSTLYFYLKRIGCCIYSIEDDLKFGNQDIFNLLSRKQQERNRELLQRELSLDSLCSELQTKIAPLILKSSI